LALVAEKWHFFVFLPLLFIAGRYWRILSGAVAAGLLILASCFLIQPGFLNEYYRALTMPKENMNAIPWAMPNIAGVFWFLKRPELACAVLALPVAWTLWRVCRRWSFEIGLSACILGGLVVAAHGYIHDWTIALPALLTLYVSAPATRLVTLLMGAPVLGSLLLLSFTTIGMTWLADILTVGLSMIALSELLRSDANLQTGHPVQDTSQSVEAPARSGGDNAHQRFACA